jgi:hypothetical protein
MRKKKRTHSSDTKQVRMQEQSLVASKARKDRSPKTRATARRNRSKKHDSSRKRQRLDTVMQEAKQREASIKMHWFLKIEAKAQHNQMQKAE